MASANWMGQGEEEGVGVVITNFIRITIHIHIHIAVELWRICQIGMVFASDKIDCWMYNVSLTIRHYRFHVSDKTISYFIAQRLLRAA